MKKNREWCFPYMESRNFSLIIKKIKLTLIFTMLVSLTFGNSYSQTKVTLHFEKATIQQVLETLEDQTGHVFLYKDEIFDPEKRYSVDFAEEPFEEVLKSVCATAGADYKLGSDRQIILTKKEKEAAVTRITLQQRTITGVVTDQQGIPLPGVTVVVKGTTIGTVTSLDGNFTLMIPQNAETLQFSFVGMRSQEIPIEGRDTFTVVMVEETIELEEVVAVGYGTLRKDELTSSVASIKSDDFTKGAVTDVAQLLTGKIAGLGIIRPDANPTSSTQISLRGITTLMSGTQPLIIIDGIPGDFNQVAPEDIESIDILKDGSAAAIYGTRGTNGVILITTKKVRTELKPTIEYNTHVSTQQITKKLDMMSAKDYRELVVQGKPGAIDGGANTDWVDEITRTPISHVHNLSLKGGSRNSNYLININFRKNQGIIKKSDNIIFTPRIEINHYMFDGKLRINANLLGREQKYWGGYDDMVYHYATLYNPTDPVIDESGNWYENPGRIVYNNPVAMLEETLSETVNNNIKTFGTISYSPIEGLDFRLITSHDVTNQTSGLAHTFKHSSTTLQGRDGIARRGAHKTVTDLLEFTINLAKSYGKHNYTALAGYSWQEGNYESFSMSNEEFPTDKYSYHNIGVGQALVQGRAGMGSYKSESKLMGYFLRINYNYDKRYLMMMSFRREGSSKFGKNNRWGNFPAISLGWNILNESFIKNVKNINELRLRAGYGVTGTEPSSPYLSQSRLAYGNSFYVDGTWEPTIYPTTNPNPQLRWEQKSETNIGLDFALWDNRVSGSFDIYKRTTKDLIWNYNVPRPPYLYGNITANAGSIENKGIETSLSFTPLKTEKISWTSTVNYSTNSNRMVSLSSDKFAVQAGYFYTGYIGEPIQVETHRIDEGGKIGNIWALKVIDIDDNGSWIILGEDNNPKPIANQTASDKRVVGNGLPKHFASWNNTLKYQDFDMEINMRGAFGYQIINYARIWLEAPINLARGNIMKSAYHNVFNKRPLNDQEDFSYNSYYVENGDYWKIDNVSLGYNFKLTDSFFDKIRIYISGLNLLTITNYKGIDPEVNVIGLAPGADSRSRYPSSRTFTLGASILF
ncbi:MAG: SusC/RagA family TonB-linked outer membrane protein [Fermentimonas sp.]|jgi:TonB-linked SusC/RagA family outer membrane protein